MKIFSMHEEYKRKVSLLCGLSFFFFKKKGVHAYINHTRPDLPPIYLLFIFYSRKNCLYVKLEEKFFGYPKSKVNPFLKNRHAHHHIHHHEGVHIILYVPKKFSFLKIKRIFFLNFFIVCFGFFSCC